MSDFDKAAIARVRARLEAMGDEGTDTLEFLRFHDALIEALKWYVENDDTYQGDDPVERLGGMSWNEHNAFWVDGLKRAEALLSVVAPAAASDAG